MKFASDTNVPVDRTRAEIEATVNRYGATAFLSGYMGNVSQVAFEMRGRQLRFILPLPDRKAAEFWATKHKKEWQRQRVDEQTAHANWEQACRQRWRALLLTIKAKLEAVECGISTFDSEFLAHIVMPDGLTLGEKILPALPDMLAGAPMPKLLPGATPPAC